MFNKVELKAAVARLFYSNRKDSEDYTMLMDYIENSIYDGNNNLNPSCSIEFRKDDMVIRTNCLRCGSKMNIAIDKKVADDFCSAFEVMKCEDTKAQKQI